MPDDRSMKGPQDSSRVNVNEDYELSYWTKRFGVSAEELKRAVHTVGVSVKALEEHFKKHPHSK